jgi:hypothetical protein
MNECQFEDILVKYPELVESALSVKGRQIYVDGKYVDILFEDRHGQKLIIELKKGAIIRKHIAQLLDYEGYFLNSDDPTVRVMLVGNRVPNNLRKALDHHGFEWKEITESTIKHFLISKEDNDLLKYFADEHEADHITEMSKTNTNHAIHKSNKTILAKICTIFNNKYIGKILSSKEIIDLVIQTYPGTNRTSVISSDYCYNITNKGISFKNHIFEYLENGNYKVLGHGYDYEGPISWKGEQVGEWRKGEKRPFLWKDINH